MSFSVDGADALKQEYMPGEYEKSICQERQNELRINSKLDSDYILAKVFRNIQIHYIYQLKIK